MTTYCGKAERYSRKKAAQRAAMETQEHHYEYILNEKGEVIDIIDHGNGMKDWEPDAPD